MLLYCLCIQGSAQKSNIDSLKISLSVAKDDTIRAILLTQIGIAYRRNEASPLAFQYANEALRIFAITVSINGHDSSHDQGLMSVKQLLEPK